MANEYIVNSADLKTVADAIRTKGGTSAQLAFPSGFVSAIQAIKSGTEVKTKTGAVTLSSGVEVSVDCGFQPDCVILSSVEIISPNSSLCFATGVDFNFIQTSSHSMFFASLYNPVAEKSTTFQVAPSAYGISFLAGFYEKDGTFANYTQTFDYYAIKYT